MSFPGGYSNGEAQLLITLSAYAYLDGTALPGETVAAQETRMRTDIDAALVASAYSSWQVAWGPALSDDRANMLYVATESASNQAAVVIRGTNWSFWLDWIEDLASLRLVPFTEVVPVVSSGTPQIASGTAIGLQTLLNIQPTTPSSAQVDLSTFLAESGSTTIFVTGHSLGGCLASVVAPTLVKRLGSSRTIKAYTFAAPTAGNHDFAQYCDRLFMDAGTGDSRAFRIYNAFDIVPMSWGSLPEIETLYPPPGPHCTVEIKALVDWAQARVAGEYEQVGIEPISALALHGQVVAETTVSPLADLFDSDAFFREVQYQHATETYMQLLSAMVTSPAIAKLRVSLRRRVTPSKQPGPSPQHG